MLHETFIQIHFSLGLQRYLSTYNMRTNYKLNCMCLYSYIQQHNRISGTRLSFHYFILFYFIMCHLKTFSLATPVQNVLEPPLQVTGISTLRRIFLKPCVVTFKKRKSLLFTTFYLLTNYNKALSELLPLLGKQACASTACASTKHACASTPPWYPHFRETCPSPALAGCSYCCFSQRQENGDTKIVVEDKAELSNSFLFLWVELKT